MLKVIFRKYFSNFSFKVFRFLTLCSTPRDRSNTDGRNELNIGNLCPIIEIFVKHLAFIIIFRIHCPLIMTLTQHLMKKSCHVVVTNYCQCKKLVKTTLWSRHDLCFSGLCSGLLSYIKHSKFSLSTLMTLNPNHFRRFRCEI